MNCGGFSSREYFVYRDLVQNAGQVCRERRVKWQGTGNLPVVTDDTQTILSCLGSWEARWDPLIGTPGLGGSLLLICNI